MPRSSPSPAPFRQQCEDGALDTVAAVLRSLARALEQASRARAQELEAWARHVLVLESPPGWEGDPPTGRAWGDVRRVAVGSIQEEFSSFTRTIGDFQDVIWAMIEQVGNALADEARYDHTTAECLERLRAAAERPPAELREVALEAVGVLGQVLQARRSSHDEMTTTLGGRIQSLSSELERARQEADIEPLTQLANRGVFDRELGGAVHLRTLVGDPTTIVLVDLDGFKAINDLHGHTAGDEALRLVSRELCRTFPRKDDTVARYGGDEFAVILRHANAEDGVRIAGRLLERLREQTLESPRGAFSLAASVGVAEIAAGTTPAEALAAADEALYRAKSSGRDRVEVAGGEAAEAAAGEPGAVAA